MDWNGMLHLRTAPYEVRHQGAHLYMLPLIERRGQSYCVRVDVLCMGAEANGFVRAHLGELRPGASLVLRLQGLKPAGDLMHAHLLEAPSIAPRPAIEGRASLSNQERPATA